jgi:hypothetical protein
MHRKILQTSKITLLFALVLCASCSIGGKLGGLYGYYNSTQRDFPGLLVHPGSAEAVCQHYETPPSKVYVVNGHDLKRCLLENEYALVYLWQPNCSSEFCYPLERVQERCRDQDIELFIVAEYYDGAKMSAQYDIARPILGIDLKYYQSNLTKRYLPRFMRDLTGSSRSELSLHLFKNGLLQKRTRSLAEISRY